MVNSTHRGSTQSRTILMAVTLFALAGLALGFGFGALAHNAKNNQQQVNTPHHTNAASAPVVKKTPIATPTLTAQVQQLGCPVITNYTTASPQNTVVFNITLKAMTRTPDVAVGCHNMSLEQPITADNIICRIFMVKAQDSGPGATPAFDANQLKYPNQEGPIREDIPNGMQIISGSQKVQPCQQGTASWQVSLSPTLPRGLYLIVGVTDSGGISYNWSWIRAFKD